MGGYLIGVMVVASITVAGCSRGSRPGTNALQIAGDPGAVVNRINDVPAQTPYVFELMPVCTTEGASAITDVRLIKPDNVELINWGVRARSGVGGHERANGIPLDLTDLGGFNHNHVTNKCTDPDDATELGVTLTKSRTGTALVHGFYIYYTSGGRSARLLDDFTIAMCPGDCPGFKR